MRDEFQKQELARRNLSLFASSEEIMTQLRAKLEAASDSEVLRYAIKFLYQLLADQAEGMSLYVRAPDGVEYVVSYQSLKSRADEDQTVVKRNVKLNQASSDRINKMKETVGINSDSELVRRALRYLWLVTTESERGCDFILTDGKNEMLVRMDVLNSIDRSSDNNRESLLGRLQRKVRPHVHALM